MLNDQNFQEEIQKRNLVLVDFFATWCEPCSVLAPILEKAVESFRDKIDLFKINVDDFPLISQKYNVERIPFVVLFKKGKPIQGFVGLKPEQDIKEWLAVHWYEDYAKENNFKLNPNKSTVQRIIKGLFNNEKKYGQRYCPCKRVTGDPEQDKKNICPCASHKKEIEENGQCFCNLFKK